MSDVPISLYTSIVKLTGENIAPPSLPPSLEETQPALNPPGTSDISGLVPYNGAIDNVDLGEQGLSTGFVKYDNTPTDTPTDSGTVVWNPDKYTLDLNMGLGGSVQQIGMETYYTPVKNQTGSLIPNGTFVMATGSLGASGRITVAPAVTDGSVDSKYMLGVTTHDIADGEDGLITWFGEIRGFNTNTKAPVGETWVDGTVLWNNPAVAGGFTSVEPVAPNLKIPVAIVISAGNNGVIFVRPRLGMRLTDLHDVNAFTPSSNDLIAYNGTKWEAVSRESIVLNTLLTGYTVGSNAALASTDTILAAFGKVQGQINAKIGGTIASGQVAFGTGAGTIGGDNDFTFNSTTNLLTLAGGITLTSAQTIQTSTGNLTIATGGGNGSIIHTATGTGVYRFSNDQGDIVISKLVSDINFSRTGVSYIRALNGPLYLKSGPSFNTDGINIDSNNNIGLGTTSPLDKLRINGTVKIDTINNLGTSATEVLVPSATGVVSKRTVAELREDIGAIGGTGTTNYIPKFTASGNIGDSILASDANGVYNTGKGNSTLFGFGAGLNDDGTDNANTFVGYDAGRENTVGIRNSFFGLSAGQSNTTGSLNSFFGRSAGFNNTTGSLNSFFGLNAGQSNTTGANNSFFGLQAGFSNTTGGDNSFFGLNAGFSNTTGVNNSFFGLNAGRSNTTGANNSFFGRDAGRYISSGANLTVANNSVFIGFDTRANADNETNQIVIGHTAIGGGSNTTTIGNSSTVSTRIPAGSLWINTTSGTNTLDVNGTARIRTISNLGTSATEVLVPSATGVVSKRTLAELASDGGFGSKWTDGTGFIYRNGPVVIGQTTLPNINSYFHVKTGSTSNGNSKSISFIDELDFEYLSFTHNKILSIPSSSIIRINNPISNSVWDSGFVYKGGAINGNLGSIFTLLASNDSPVFEVRTGLGAVFHNPLLRIGGISATNNAEGGPTIKGGAVNGNLGNILTILNSSEGLVMQVRPTRFIFYPKLFYVGNPTSPISNGAHFKGLVSNTSEVFRIDNSSDIPLISILGNGDINYSEGSDWGFGTTTGTKIGTATTQKLAFWNATPIVQPTTAVTGATLVGGGGTTITDTDTFDGYTLAQIVKALRNTGLLA